MTTTVFSARAIVLALSLSLFMNPVGAQPARTLTSDELVTEALRLNQELQAARLEVTRARARLDQSALIPNPVLELEQTGGSLGTSPGELERRAQISIPIEYGGKRGRRADVAREELHVAEAVLADRERRLVAEVRTLYTEAVAAARELAFTSELTAIDAELARILTIRVEEGDAPPLEARLLEVEVDRVRSRRAMLVGRSRAAELRLAATVGFPLDVDFSLSEDYGEGVAPPTIDDALRLAFERRPDLRAADFAIAAAESGRRLATARALPDVTLFGGYSRIESSFDNTPVGPLDDEDELFNAGIGMSLPLFDRGQAAKAEADASIEQARHLRELAERQVHAEVASALARYQSAEAAVEVFRSGVVARSMENLRTMRAAYEAGAFTITEFLAERRRLVDAERELNDALSERAIALIDLHAAIAEPHNNTKESD
jgi:cobalt-zinc-cadmium efflux system outer membrane protein